MVYIMVQKIEKGISDGIFIVGDDFYGLLWGEVGRVWGWLMIEVKLDFGYFSYIDVQWQ